MSFPCPYSRKEDEEKIFAALTTFLGRATWVVYFSFVGKLDKDALISLRKDLTLLVEETKIKGMFHVLGVTWEPDIDISSSLLKRQEEYHRGAINEALQDHIMSLRHGIEFLKRIREIYFDRDLELRIRLFAGNAKRKLQLLLAYKQEDVIRAYSDLREEMKNLIINPETNRYDSLFPKFSQKIHHYRGDNDFLLEKITTLLTSNCKAGQIAPIKKELQDLGKMLIILKPLGRYVGSEVGYFGIGDNSFATLLTIHHKATFLIYLSFIVKMNTEMVFTVKSEISAIIKEIDVSEVYTLILSKFLVGKDCFEGELCLLEHLILLLKSNADSFNDASSKLYKVLIDVHVFLLDLFPSVLLRKLHILQPSFHAILGHSIPIICSCYLEHTQVDISAELNFVLDLIKHIKSESQEIKLYYFPKVDDLGFLEFFSGYLEDQMKNQELSIKENIDALHFEIHSLLSLAKSTNQQLNQIPWSDMINMAYQAEYIVDHYLVSSSINLVLISSLTNIIDKLKNIRADVQALCREGLPTQVVAVDSKSKPNVLGTTRQVGDYDSIVGFQEESRIIIDHLLRGEYKLDVISIVLMAGVGKTTLAMSLYKTPSTAGHFDILAWCTVSQSYHNRDLLLTILDQVDSFDINHSSILDDQDLADFLYKTLRKRRYLIVLDDIWDIKLWNYLKCYLPDDSGGSRILITTRNRDVADQIGSKVNELHGLSKEKSWELFQKKVGEKEISSRDLVGISKGIVENCRGLPLSIVIIAGILSDMERTKTKWNQVAESVSSLVLLDSQGKCKAILELSYNHLPNHLRSCFLYLGSFQEDQEISVNRLILLWMAEGLVRDTKSESAEEVAKMYIEALIAKNLVMPSKDSSRGGVRTFRLHDLLHDLCVDKAEEKHVFTLVDNSVATFKK